MNRRSFYTPIAARGTYSSSRRIRLTITLSLFNAGAVAFGLLEALQAAANEAAAEDITFYVNSGWVSPRLQERLLEEAVAEYGSREEALRWVATPERSAHVLGDAVDISPFDASYWLSYNGAQYDICQIYANEGWHFELRPDAVERGCPELYTDPTEDPRMR